MDRLQTSSRDADELRRRLQEWLEPRLHEEGARAVSVDRCQRPEANGMSSDTLLFDASWDGPPQRSGAGESTGRTTDAADPPSSGRTRQRGRFVARLAPATDACPIFPTYDLETQVAAMRLVAERTQVPVPQVHWYEPDPGPLGAPFFVMTRAEGQVPPDVMPYPFDGSWVKEARPAQRLRMQQRTIAVLADIHRITLSDDNQPQDAPLRSGTGATPDVGEVHPLVVPFLAPAPPDGTVDSRATSPLRRHFEAERRFYTWAQQGLRFPVLEQAFGWLEERWPTRAEAEPSVLCWGDARIGNILYQEFEPQAVLDWEMVTVAPRELDLGWFVFLHQFFDDIALEMGMTGLPDFLQRDDVAQEYTRLTGHEPRDLDWFLVYAALRHGIVMTRAMRRRVHFGEMEMPDDPEELIMHRRRLAEMLTR